MKGTKITLVAATAQLIAQGGVVKQITIDPAALTDVFLGGASGITSGGNSSYGLRAAIPLTMMLTGDLWAISAAGGVIYALETDG